MTTYPVFSTMGVGRGIRSSNDSVWRLQPPATSPNGLTKLWGGNSGSSTPPAMMRTRVYGMAADGSVWEYTPPNLTKISSTFVPTTWNPADLSNINLTNNNLTATGSTNTTNGVRAIGSAASGKFYCECTFVKVTFSGTGFGLAQASVNLNQLYNAPSGTTGIYQNGQAYVNGISLVNFGAALTSGTIVSIAVDLTALKIWFRVAAGNWNNSGTANPATGVGGLDLTPIAGALFPFFSAQLLNEQGTANFGASAFNGTVPTGFTAGWGTLQ